MVAALDRQRRGGIDRLPRLVDPPVAGEDQPGEDQRLRPRPAFGEAEGDELLVGARSLAARRAHRRGRTHR